MTDELGSGHRTRTERRRTERRREELARRKAERRRQAAASRVPRERPLPNVPLLVPALVGVGLAGYLTAVALLDTTPLACDLGSGCDAVQSSRFASFAGIPTAAWGAVAFAALVTTALAVRNARTHWLLALGLSSTALAVSLYLTAVSIFEIGATCLWCLGSLAAVATCFGVTVHQRPRAALPLGLGRPIAAIAAVSALLVGGLHLHYRGAFDPAFGPEDPQLRALASHLDAIDARFYGASWCPHCEDQKELFGASAHRLPFVECSTGGPGTPQTPPCIEAGIRTYPTWIIRGERHLGLLSVNQLARLSGFGGASTGTP